MLTTARPRPMIARSHWQLDPDRTRIDFAVRNRIARLRTRSLVAIHGAMEWDELQFAASAIELAAGTEKAPVDGRAAIRFQSIEIRPVDAIRFDVTGQLTIGDAAGNATFRVHDLGSVPDPEYGRRRILAIRGTLDRRPWRIRRRRRSLLETMDDRTMEVIVHAEWIPDLSPAAA